MLPTASLWHGNNDGEDVACLPEGESEEDDADGVCPPVCRYRQKRAVTLGKNKAADAAVPSSWRQQGRGGRRRQGHVFFSYTFDKCCIYELNILYRDSYTVRAYVSKVTPLLLHFKASYVTIVENNWKKHSASASVFRHVCNISGVSARHADHVCTPAECLGSERGIVSAPGRYSQNVCKCIFSLLPYLLERTVHLLLLSLQQDYQSGPQDNEQRLLLPTWLVGNTSTRDMVANCGLCHVNTTHVTKLLSERSQSLTTIIML